MVSVAHYISLHDFGLFFNSTRELFEFPKYKLMSWVNPENDLNQSHWLLASYEC